MAQTGTTLQKETVRIADQLRRAVHGPAWHGPSLLESLDGVTAAKAAARPLPGAHSIHELVAHATAWIDIVRQRVEGNPPGVTDEMDWPAVSDDAWPAARARLLDVTERLEAAVRSLDDGRLSDDIPVDGDRWSVYGTLHGVIQHALYHAGQIAVLKKGLP
jgi:hypothetical protein